MSKPLPPPWDRFVPFLRRLLIWVLFFGALWLLRPFFFLVFLTFVFGYVMSHAVDRMKPAIPNRTARVVTSLLVLLSLLVGVSFYIGPDLVKQATAFADQLDPNLKKLDAVIGDMREKYPTLQSVLPEDQKAKDILAAIFVQRDVPPAGARTNHELFDLAVKQIKVIAGQTIFIVSSLLLALLFSFLVVLDLPKIARGIKRLHDTRFGYVYDELSDSVFHFGAILGRALEAQLMIAILNTAMTAIGLAVMDLPNIAFLSTVVFLCSFIPVAGVFISSVPICLTALVESGLGLFFVSIAFITVIHMIEAYILNPRIYGAHLRMNPVLVLAILVISHHLFGIWGLVLGVPTANFIVQYVIRYVSGGEPQHVVVARTTAPLPPSPPAPGAPAGHGETTRAGR